MKNKIYRAWIYGANIYVSVLASSYDDAYRKIAEKYPKAKVRWEF